MNKICGQAVVQAHQGSVSFLPRFVTTTAASSHHSQHRLRQPQSFAAPITAKGLSEKHGAPPGAESLHCFGSSKMAAQPQPILAPSILAADFANLAYEVKRIVDAGTQWVHCDCFDGVFVPNLTIGPPVIKSLRKHTDAFLDCHLCVVNPQNYLKDMAAAGASQFTFHIEAEGINFDTDKAIELAREVRATGMMAGIALVPDTPAESVYAVLEAGVIDTVLLLSVRPGFGGQKFSPLVLPKVRALRARFPSVNILVDGGITLDNAADVAAAGANALVAGTTVFAGPKPTEVIVPELVGLIAAGLERGRAETAQGAQQAQQEPALAAA